MSRLEKFRNAAIRPWPQRWTSSGYNERLAGSQASRGKRGWPRTFGPLLLAIRPRWIARRGQTGPVGPRGWAEQAYNERLDDAERDRG